MVRVSVIICCYNRKQYVSQAIESALNQNSRLKDGEEMQIKVFVGDDCSTDGSRQVLEEYAGRYRDRVFLNFQTTNSGIGYNWASTVKKSDGEFIANLDDDDYWNNPDKLSIEVDYLREHPDVSVVGTDYRTLNIITGKQKDMVLPHPYPSDLPSAIWNGTYPMLQSSTLIRRTDLDRFVKLDDFMEYHFPLQDWPTLVLLSRHTVFAHIPVITTTYRIGQSSITNCKSVEKVAKRMERSREMCKYLTESNSENFDEEDYANYSDNECLKAAYRYRDYASAHKYGKMAKVSGLKAICSKNRLLFYAFCCINSIRKDLKYGN